MKLYQKYLFILLLILVGFIAYFYLQNKQIFINRVQNVLLNILDKEIENEKARSFNFAFALSKNERIQEALQNNDAKEAYNIIHNHMKALETFSGSKINIQIIKKDFTIFARSWDNRDAGINVKENRPDLQEMKKTLKTHLSYEAARKLVLIASIPIIKNKKFIGFLEVIQRFDSIENYFSQYGIDVIVLLNNQYENQAVLLVNNPRIKNMIVANSGANINHIQNIKKLNLEKLKNLGLEQNSNYLYLSKVILNFKGDPLGYFILVLSKEKLKLFSDFEKELESLFIYSRKDLYYNIIKINNSVNTYSDLTSKELLNLKKCAKQEDKKYIEKQLREKLQKYTKEELIPLLLNVNSNKISRGKIK